MTKYAVTGATGHFGQIAIQTLVKLVAENEIIAIVRDPEKAKATLPNGVEIRQADYGDTGGMTEALKGVDKLLFISSQPGGAVPRDQQHQNVVEAAKAAGVSFVAYTSFPHADTAKSPLASDHKITEAAIVKAGFKHAFLRNNWYLQNELATIQGALQGQTFVYSAADGHAGWALEREYAEAAAKVLVLADPKPIYEFAGPSITYSDLARGTQQVAPQSFQVASVSDSAYTQGLENSGLDQATAQVVTSFQTLIRQGDLAESTTDLQDVLGHALVPLTDAINEIK